MKTKLTKTPASDWIGLLAEMTGNQTMGNQIIWLLIPGNAELLKNTGKTKGFSMKGWYDLLKSLHLKETTTLHPLPFD